MAVTLVHGASEVDYHPQKIYVFPEYTHRVYIWVRSFYILRECVPIHENFCVDT